MTALRRLWDTHAPMTAMGVACGIAAVAIAGVLTFDQRHILGAPVWFKPLKFMLSTAIYGITIAWLLTLLPKRSRLAWGALAVGAAAWTIELVLIVMQASRGAASHFNTATGFDTAVWVGMGMTATILWVTNLVAAGVVLTNPEVDRLRSTAVLLGLGLAILGMGVAYLMPTRFDTPPAELRPGVFVELAGAHAVGVADGGPGLPLLGWSTEGGDLRVAHFVGLHGLQVIPLLALLATTRRDLDERRRVALVRVGAAGYAGLVLLLTWQALRGQALLAPDALTSGVLLALLVGVIAGVLLVTRPRAVPSLPADPTEAEVD